MEKMVIALILAAWGTAAAPPARAERHFWRIRDTTALDEARWDPRTGTLVTARKRAEPGGPALAVVERIDPVRRTRAVLAEEPMPADGEDPGGEPVAARIGGLLLAPGGTVELLLSGAPGQSRLVRIPPAGDKEVLPIRSDHWLEVIALAAGPDGTRYLVDTYLQQVARLTPCPAGSDGVRPPGFDLTAIAGRGLEPVPDAERDGPWAAPGYADLEPGDVAVTAAGDLLVIDRAHSRIVRMTPDPRPGAARWRLATMAGSGSPHWRGDGHADARDTSLGALLNCRVAADGRVFAAEAARLWEFTPYQAQGGGERWRSRRIAGRALAAAERIPPFGAMDAPRDSASPASELPFVTMILDLLPGDCLLLADHVDGLGVLGPDRDAPLARLVHDHRRLHAAGEAARAAAIREGLLEHMRSAPDGTYDLPLSPLTAGGSDPIAALPGELRQHLASFLHDPWTRAFRAALALDAMLEGIAPPSGAGGP